VNPVSQHLVIDGYNLLGASGRGGAGIELWSEAAREDLLHRLRAYRQRKGHAITVVFDGWRAGATSEQRDRQGGVEVIYSRRGEVADHVIRRLASDYGKDCVVISSDGEVGRSARMAGALVIRAEEFWRKLCGPPSRPAAPPFKELDAEPDPRDHRAPGKKGNPRKLPKALRKRNRQLRGF
jgi:predicted RNA-binding protein with PIN domain